MSLLPELWGEVGKYIDRRDQSNFRSVCSVFSRIPFDLEQCCSEPTHTEIATWLYHQSQLLAYENSYRYSLYGPLVERKVVGVVFWKLENKDEDDGDVSLLLDTSNGELTGSDLSIKPGSAESPNSIIERRNFKLNSIDEILSAIHNTQLKIRFLEDNYQLVWVMIRDILSLRHSCIARGFSSDRCYIKLLIENLAMRWLDDLRKLPLYLNDDLIDKLAIDLGKELDLDEPFPVRDEPRIYHLFAQRPDVNTIYFFVIKWLKWWLSEHLTAADLKPHPQINYANTYYT